jgi:hypothetical protein
MLSAIFGMRNLAYFVSLRVPRQPMAAGAECVWVALTIMRSVGILHCLEASAFASSMRLCSIMQVSTMQKAIFILPSSSTMDRAESLEMILSQRPSKKPPAMMRGKVLGVISVTTAPARNSAASKEKPAKLKAVIRWANQRFILPIRIWKAQPSPKNKKPRWRTTVASIRVTILLELAGQLECLTPNSKVS